MVTGFVAVFTNCALNYVLIFGKFGAPALGTEGAAIATVISRYVECAVFITYVFIKRKASAAVFPAPNEAIKAVMNESIPPEETDSE